MKYIMSLALAFFLTGCAHNIKVTPDAIAAEKTKSKTPVGYFISAADKTAKFTTPGGGGDKVSYQLAKDMEYGFFSALNNSYDTVKVLETSHDVEKMKADGIALVFEPKFSSTSSGSSMLIWPADKFTITVKCKAYNKTGALVLDKDFTGQGTAANNSELMSNFAIAANRAATDVLTQVQKELATNAALK
jgi:hypothetical protein